MGVLEGCFLVNMVLFSSGATVLEVQGGSKDTLACTSLGISFVLFLAIIGYSVYRNVACSRSNKEMPEMVMKLIMVIPNHCLKHLCKDSLQFLT